MYANEASRSSEKAPNSVRSNLEILDKSIQVLGEEVSRLRLVAERLGGSVPMEVASGGTPDRPSSDSLREVTGRLGNDLDRRIEDIRQTITRIENTIG